MFFKYFMIFLIFFSIHLSPYGKMLFRKNMLVVMENDSYCIRAHGFSFCLNCKKKLYCMTIILFHILKGKHFYYYFLLYGVIFFSSTVEVYINRAKKSRPGLGPRYLGLFYQCSTFWAMVTVSVWHNSLFFIGHGCKLQC